MGSAKKELLIFSILFFIGALVLPFCIYIVGQSVIGEYSPDSGAFGLVMAIWGDLTRFRLGAWILVLSPWAVISLLRLAIGFLRAPARSRQAAES